MANVNNIRSRRQAALERLKEVDPGTIKAAKQALWEVIADGLQRLDRLSEDDTAGYSKVSHSIVAATREFRSIFEAHEIEARVTELERQQSKGRGFQRVGVA